MSTTVRRASAQTVRSVAIAQDRDISRVVSRGSLLVSRIWRTASQAARAGHHGLEFDPRGVQLVKDELIDIMAYAYLLRRRLDTRRRRAAKSIELGYAYEQSRRIAAQIDIDLGNLRDKFAPLANRHVNDSFADIKRTMQQALAQARYRKLTERQSVAYVIGRLRKHGIEPRSTQYVETLVRTHASIAYGAAHRASFMGDTDVWGFELVTMRDDRVRDSHEATDGIRRKRNDPFWTIWWPPNGWNCRCQAVPIYDHSTRQTPIPDDLEPDSAFETDWLYLVGLR